MKWIDPWTCSVCGFHGSVNDSGDCRCEHCDLATEYDESVGSERCPRCQAIDCCFDYVGDACPACGSVVHWGQDSGGQFQLDRSPPFLDWIVVGGESGPGARPFDIAWARSTVEQCKAAGVPVFVKQLGAKPLERQPSLDKGFAGRDLLDVMTRPRPPQMDGWGRITTETETFYQRHLDLNDRKGGDIDEWPADLRVREWPEVRS